MKKIDPTDILGQVFGQLRVEAYLGLKPMGHAYSCVCLNDIEGKPCLKTRNVLRSSLTHAHNRAKRACKDCALASKKAYRLKYSQGFIFGREATEHGIGSSCLTSRNQLAGPRGFDRVRGMK